MASSLPLIGLIEPAGFLGALCTVTTAGWKAIDQWVAWVPGCGFSPALVTACQQWQSTNQDRAFRQVWDVGQLAEYMVPQLKNLQSLVSETPSGHALPLIWTINYQVALEHAASQAVSALADLDLLAAEVDSFVAINQKFEPDLKTFAQEWGCSYRDAVEWLNTIGPALKKLQTGWRELIITQKVSPVPATNTRLLRNDLNIAVGAWSALQQSTVAFIRGMSSGSAPPPGLQPP